MSGAGSSKKPVVPRKVRKRLGPVSLHPLDFDTAIRGLLGVKVPAGEERDASRDPDKEES